MKEMSNEAHVALIWSLMSVLYIVLCLRTWALRNSAYSMLSPRGVSTTCIVTTTFATTVVCAMVTWSLVGPYRDVPRYVFDTLYSPSLSDSGFFTFEYNPRVPMEIVFKVNFASMLLFYIVLWLVKVAFVVIYFEFSKDLSRRTRNLLYITIGAIAVSFMFVVCLSTLWCLPVSGNWDFDEVIQAQSCRASVTPSAVISVINVIMDILIMAAGFSIISSLKLPRGDFRSAFLIIAIGALTVVVAFCRMIVLIVRMTKEDTHYTSYYYMTEFGEGNEQGRIYVPVQESVVGYAEIEAILACTAACLPGIRVLFRRSARAAAQRWTFKDSADASCCMSISSPTPPYSPPTSPPMVFEKRQAVHEMV